MHLYSTRGNDRERASSNSSSDVSGKSKTLKNPSYKIEVTPKCEQEESDEEENYDDLFGGRAAAAPPSAQAPTGSASSLDVKPSMPPPSSITNSTPRPASQQPQQQRHQPPLVASPSRASTSSQYVFIGNFSFPFANYKCEFIQFALFKDLGIFHDVKLDFERTDGQVVRGGVIASSIIFES